MSETKLKPCPFCGGEVRLHIAELDAFRNVYSFLCEECDFEMIYPYSNEEEAIKAYNTRKPIEEIVERLEEVAKKVSEEVWRDYEERVIEESAIYNTIEILKEVTL